MKEKFFDASPKEQPKPLDDQSLLHDILLDRMKKPDSLGLNLDIPPLPENISLMRDNLNLLSLLNGHRGQSIRRLVQENHTPEASYLHNLYGWSVRQAASQEFDFEPLLEPCPKFLAASNFEEENLYERLRFTERNPAVLRENYSEELLMHTATALGAPDKQLQWIDLIDKVFDGNPATLKIILEKVGFIPTELLTKKRFKTLGGARLTEAIKQLRQFETSHLQEEALHERAKLINHLFLSKNADDLRKKNEKNVSLDSNGLFINLKDFHSHLPYGLVTNALVQALRQDNWITPDESLEIHIRKNEANSERGSYLTNTDEQISHFANNVGIKETARHDRIEALKNKLIQNPKEFLGIMRQQALILPDALIHEIVRSKDVGEIYSLMELAELNSIRLSEEQYSEELYNFSTHALTSKTKESYQAREKILNHPDYYNSVKIIKALLRADIHSEPENKFLILRGQYKKSKLGSQHSFIEILHHGKLARVLIDEKKHLDPEEENGLDHIPLFEREKYESLENALLTFNHYSSSLESLKSELQQDWRKKPDRVIMLAENCLHFLLTNVTGYYQRASELCDTVRAINNDDKKLTDLLQIFDNAKTNYSEFFHENIASQIKFTEKFSPEIKKNDLSFGQDYFATAKEHTLDHGRNEKLCLEAQPIRLAIINYKTGDPTQAIPYHIEESCLDAIRLQRGRPFINVIGGCRELKSSSADQVALHPLSAAVIKVAHNHKANVGVPGTQSGIGIAFGFQNNNYRKQFQHLPHAEKAHLFSINPGGNVFFPNNEFMEETPRAEIFANTPVDTIVTPFKAGWELNGKAKYQSPYLNHIAYMEALYKRIGFGNKKVMVVGNGGLYSIAEINDSMSHDFDLIIVKNSGRFAEAATALLEHLDKINAPTADLRSEQVIEIIEKNLDPEVAQEFFKKDFGFDAIPENENYEVYRVFFFKFLKLAQSKRSRISITTVENLETDLENYLRKG